MFSGPRGMGTTGKLHPTCPMTGSWHYKGKVEGILPDGVLVQPTVRRDAGAVTGEKVTDPSVC